MILWILCLTAFALTTSKCEPPVNSYLPPNSGSGSGPGGRPSSQYGPPGGDRGRTPGGFNPVSSSFGSQSEDSYNSAGISPSSPSGEYGVPGQGSGGFLRGGSRESQVSGQGFAPSSEYGSPNQRGSNRVASRPFQGRGSSQKPDSTYGTPSNEYRSPSGTSNNGINSGQGSRQLFVGSPSSSYGTPDFGNDLSNKNKNYRGSGVNESKEPAKYEFSYEVDDPDTGTKFGHSEQRDGDVTTGEYNVVLPDGRKQVVEYEADREGYKPQIRYEGTGSGTGSGFGRGAAQGRDQGYDSADANAFSRNGDGYPQSGNVPQGGRYQQSSFGQGSDTSDYPRTDGQSFDNQGQGYFGSKGSGGYPGSGLQGGRSNYPGSQGNGGYSTGSQGRGSSRGGGRGPNDFGGNDGYPSGGPNGPRGSGY